MSAVAPSVCLVTMMSAKVNGLASPMSLSRARLRRSVADVEQIALAQAEGAP